MTLPPSEGSNPSNTQPGTSPGLRTPTGESVGQPDRGMFGVVGSGDTSGFGGLVRPPYAPPPTDRPYGGYFDEVVDSLTEALSEQEVAYADAIYATVVDRDELTLYVHREQLKTVARTLRDDAGLRFEMCASVSGVDYLDSRPEDPYRLHVVYQLRSYSFRRIIRLEVAVSVEDPHLPTVTDIYPTADWQERETYDFFGTIFDGHPALTRILMPDDWEGYPQRKDYPLGGIAVEYKGAEIPPPDERRAYK